MDVTRDVILCTAGPATGRRRAAPFERMQTVRDRFDEQADRLLRQVAAWDRYLGLNVSA